MKRAVMVSGMFMTLAAPSLAQDLPRFDIEKECRSVPLEGAQNWCLREERCNEKWLALNWREMTAGVSNDAIASCARLAQASGVYRYWTLRHCLAPAPRAGEATCE